MRYFFHLEDGSCIRDPKGTEFPDDASAMQEAAKVARGLSEEISQEQSKHRMNDHEWQVVVMNADGLRIGSVPVQQANPAEVAVTLRSIQ